MPQWRLHMPTCVNNNTCVQPLEGQSSWLSNTSFCLWRVRRWRCEEGSPDSRDPMPLVAGDRVGGTQSLLTFAMRSSLSLPPFWHHTSRPGALEAGTQHRRWAGDGNCSTTCLTTPDARAWSHSIRLSRWPLPSEAVFGLRRQFCHPESTTAGVLAHSHRGLGSQGQTAGLNSPFPDLVAEGWVLAAEGK